MGTIPPKRMSLRFRAYLLHAAGSQNVAFLDIHGDASQDIIWLLTERGYFRCPDVFEKLVYIPFGGRSSIVPFNAPSPELSVHHGDPYAATADTLQAMIRVWPELWPAVAASDVTDAVTDKPYRPFAD